MRRWALVLSVVASVAWAGPARRRPDAGQPADAAAPSGFDAKDQYLQAYQLKDSDPERARALFKEVVDRTPPKNEWHKKAQERLKQLHGR